MSLWNNLPAVSGACEISRGLLRPNNAWKPTPSRQWFESGGRRHRALEHRLPGANGYRDPPNRPDRIRRDTRPPLTTQVGAHQPYRRLPLAQGRRAPQPQITPPQDRQIRHHSLTAIFDHWRSDPYLTIPIGDGYNLPLLRERALRGFSVAAAPLPLARLQ